jgi:hypothetical protein
LFLFVRRTLVFLALVALCLGGLAPGKFELFDYNPVANAKAVVVSGKARFSVLTDRLIRIEWSEKVTGFIPLFATADCASRLSFFIWSLHSGRRVNLRIVPRWLLSNVICPCLHSHKKLSVIRYASPRMPCVSSTRSMPRSHRRHCV